MMGVKAASSSSNLPDDLAPPKSSSILPAPYLLFVGDITEPAFSKTAFGLRDWARDKCVGECVSDDRAASTGLPRLSPAQGAAQGARAIIIAVANSGGQIPLDWQPTLLAALEAGLDIISGMHVRLADVPGLAAASARYGRRLIDVRVPPADIPIGTGAKRPGKRLLTVGTDCALGKKYTALALAAAFEARGLPCDFRASGQTGIMIAGGGIPIDAVVSDFAAGAAEVLSPAAAVDHWDIIEGQGSLFHPAYSGVSLALLHGSQPDVFVVCHDPTRTHVLRSDTLMLPDLSEVIDLTIALGRRTNPAIRCGGVALNTSTLTADASADLIAAESVRLGLAVADPIRGGPAFAALVDACLQ